MIPLEHPQRGAYLRGVGDAHLRARAAQLSPEGARHRERAEPVVKDAHPYGLPRLLGERLGEAASGTVVLELEELQVYPPLGPPDLFQPFVERLWTVAEQGEPVAGP